MNFEVDHYINYGASSQYNTPKLYFEDQVFDNGRSIFDKRELDQFAKSFGLESQAKTPILTFLGSTNISTNDSNSPQKDLMSLQAYEDDINFKFDQEGREGTETVFSEETELKEIKQDIATGVPEVVLIARKESNQSIYKNKYKEILEKSDAIIDEVLDLPEKKYIQISIELQKSDRQWAEEGKQLTKVIKDYEDIEKVLERVQDELENLKSQLKRMENIDKDIENAERKLKEMEREHPREAKKKKKLKKQIDQAKQEFENLKKEKILLQQSDLLPEFQLNAKKMEQKELLAKLEKTRNTLLDALTFKKLGVFAHIYKYKDQILTYVSKRDSAKYFEAYKKKRSMKYFKDSMKEEELFYWILVLGIVRFMTPKDKGYLGLLPLRKDTVTFMSWMIESNVMKVKHKILFRTSEVRSHLMSEITRVYNILITAAKKEVANGKWTQEKWNLLERIFGEVGANSSLFDSNSLTEDTKDMTDSEATIQTETGKRSFDEIEDGYNSSAIEIEGFEEKLEKRVFLGYY